jgi:hypothetical protein
MTPDPHERLLRGVLGVVMVAQQQLCDSVNKPRMLAHDGLQLMAQFPVGRFVHRGRVAQYRLPFNIHSFTLQQVRQVFAARRSKKLLPA